MSTDNTFYPDRAVSTPMTNPFEPPREVDEPPIAYSNLAVALRAAFVLACLFTDLFPSYGAPQFRYTGSSPERDVWNLGWPLAMFVLDPNSGLHVGPLAFVALSIQLILALPLIWLAISARRQSRHSE